MVILIYLKIFFLFNFIFYIHYLQLLDFFFTIITSLIINCFKVATNYINFP